MSPKFLSKRERVIVFVKLWGLICLTVLGPQIPDPIPLELSELNIKTLENLNLWGRVKVGFLMSQNQLERDLSHP